MPLGTSSYVQASLKKALLLVLTLRREARSAKSKRLRQVLPAAGVKRSSTTGRRFIFGEISTAAAISPVGEQL